MSALCANQLCSATVRVMAQLQVLTLSRGCTVAVPQHPRNKRPVGARLAAAAAPLVYNLHQPNTSATGPTLSGCRLHSSSSGSSGSGGAGASSITLMFNTSLLAGDAVAVGKYGPPATAGASATISSSMRVLIDPKYWRVQRGCYCRPGMCKLDSCK